ncbi:MAG: hypothetical protein ACR2OH_04600 [Microthrixaceae bacterium]
MPWCADCDRFYTPSTLSAEGDCPSGHHVADPGDAPPIVQSAAPGRDETGPKVPQRAPWHFWLLVAAVVVYLGWRLIQGVDWLFG